MGVGFRINGDVTLADNRVLRIYLNVNQISPDASPGGTGAAQIVGGTEYFDRYSVKHMKFTSATKCEATLEGRIGRARAVMTLTMDDTGDLVFCNVTKTGVPWATMTAPQPIRQSETDPAENWEYLHLFPPAAV